jgi:hypothetical protein
MLMETNFLQHIFTKENAGIIGGILGAFKTALEIHKYLKGKKPESIIEQGDKYEITNGDNAKIIVDKRVFNVYRHNENLTQSIQKNFEALSNDASVEGITIRPDNNPEPIVNISKQEFDELSKPNPFFDKEQNEEMWVDETVFIKKPNLMPEKGKVWNWELLHKGRDIKAKITDPRFELQINEGLRVAQGDRLIVDLKIFYKWHDRYNTFVESGKYEIIKVHKLIEREEQSKMFPSQL